MQRTEMADHSLESLEHMKDRTAAGILLEHKIMTGNDFIRLKLVSKFQKCKSKVDKKGMVYILAGQLKYF